MTRQCLPHHIQPAVAARLDRLASQIPPKVRRHRFAGLIPPVRILRERFADDDPEVMNALISTCARHSREAGKAFLMLGLADNDPLLAVAQRYLHVTYRSDLYAVSWTTEPSFRLDGRVAYVEIATL